MCRLFFCSSFLSVLQFLWAYLILFLDLVCLITIFLFVYLCSVYLILFLASVRLLTIYLFVHLYSVYLILCPWFCNTSSSSKFVFWNWSNSDQSINKTINQSTKRKQSKKQKISWNPSIKHTYKSIKQHINFSIKSIPPRSILIKVNMKICINWSCEDQKNIWSQSNNYFTNKIYNKVVKSKFKKSIY